ncbi:MAG: four helix bundle protein [Bacteroidetes bacterium]|nr:four helix bundle protein [Bacteroidota bacterium]
MEYTLEKLDVYQLSETFSDTIWYLVEGWNYFQKGTIGKQIVRSADSVSVNIAEGYGRFFYKESKQFYYYSRASLLETKSWLIKCKRRKVIADDLAEKLIAESEKILIKLNACIKFISNSNKHNPK